MRRARFFTIMAAFAGLCSMPALGQAQDVFHIVGDQVGIGTDTPAIGAKLHVRAASVGPVDAIFLENTTGPARIKLNNLAQSDTATTDRSWTINSNGDLRFTAGVDAAEMLLDAAGNLTVVGSYRVGATTLDVPDFVFALEYELLPLDDLESFLEEHRRLPGIPSAMEVAAEGLDMTDMQMRLLEKVEELTLYTLQQHQSIRDLQKKIDQLEQSRH